MSGNVTLHQTIKGALREGLAGPSRRPVEEATGAGARKEKGTLAVPVRESWGGSLKMNEATTVIDGLRIRAEYTERPFSTKRVETGQRPISVSGSAQLSCRG